MIAATLLIWNQGLSAATEHKDTPKADEMQLDVKVEESDLEKNLDSAEKHLQEAEKDIEKAKKAEDSKMPEPEAAPTK